MKSRLVASIYLLSTGKCWINTRSTVSARSIFSAFDRRHVQTDCSFHAQRFESSNRAIHSSALEDDAFSELGPQESEFSIKKIRLVSEKVYDFVKDDDDDDDEDYSELDLDIPECSAKEIKFATEEPNAFSEDAFSELGPGISDCSAKQLKLVTEKRDHILKTTHSHRRESGSKPVSPDYRPHVKELFEAISKASTTSSTKSCAPKELSGATTKASTTSSTKLRDGQNSKELSGATTKASTTSSTKSCAPVHVPISTDDTKRISEMEYPLSISIKNIPSEVGLPELIAAVTVFGKVSGASFVTTSNKFKCCHIEFEDADSSKGAILAGKVEVGSHIFLVNAYEDLVTVRIKNINEKTIDSVIHSICKSAGEFLGLARTGSDGVDAFFNVRNHTSHLDIVKKLNNTALDHNHWSACVLTSVSNSSEVTSDKDARYKLHSQINDQFSKLKMGLTLKKIYLQDLEYFNTCIMHIQDVPPVSIQSG